jgi:hypothetical protein
MSAEMVAMRTYVVCQPYRGQWFFERLDKAGCGDHFARAEPYRMGCRVDLSMRHHAASAERFGDIECGVGHGHFASSKRRDHRIFDALHPTTDAQSRSNRKPFLLSVAKPLSAPRGHGPSARGRDRLFESGPGVLALTDDTDTQSQGTGA